MTKKHYEAIAKIFAHHSTEYASCEAYKVITCKLLADYFAQDNPKFNRDRFLTACGVIEE